MSLAKCVLLLFILCNAIDGKFYYENIKMYGCRCILKDQRSEFLDTFASGIPMNANREIWKSLSREPPTLVSGLQSKIHYLKQWLATLALDTHTPPPLTTTTSRQTTEDPLEHPYDDSETGNSIYLKLAYKMMAKYFKKLQSEWTILDRFECHCDGDLIELLKSKTFINIQVAHD